MNSIPVAALKEGQMFSSPVLFEDDSLFVPENIPLRLKDLSLLKTLEVDHVFTQGKLVGVVDTVLKSPEKAAQQDSSVSPDKKALAADTKYIQELEKSTLEVNKKLSQLILQINSIFQLIKYEQDVNVRNFWQITATLLHIIKMDKRSSVAFILGNSVNGCDMAKNAINIAILSALISEDMELNSQDVPEIVAAALLHDCGMLRLPDEIVLKKGTLNAEEAKIISSHPVNSYKIICKELLCTRSVGIAALQHHERWDGSGYPQGLAGKDIAIGALIVSAADAFEAMVSQKAYRNSLTGYQAMKNIVSGNAAHFSPIVLKSFVKIMGIYPIGSIVQLNDGSTARIIELNSDIPLRPLVQIVAYKDSKTTNAVEGGTLIDLIQNKKLYITKALS
ncbi:MAG: HD-GYP domain-containing protein [Termitinemataceae bacterium]|nr:MAG: HD-GYP domain-containing protein [Termitinemataceae bacterium]